MKRLRLGVLSIIAVTAMALAPPGSVAVEETMKNPVQIQTLQIATIATLDVSMVSLDQNVTAASTIANRTHQPIGWVTPPGVNAIKSSGATIEAFSSTKSIMKTDHGHQVLNEPASKTKTGFDQATTAVQLQKTARGLERSPPNRGQIIQV